MNKKEKIMNQDYFRDDYAIADSRNQEEETYTVDEVLSIIDDSMQDATVLYEAKDYDGVLPKLLNIYEVYTDKKIFTNLEIKLGSDELSRRYARLCFMISYCYCEQQDYIRAFFYIDPVRGVDSNCFMEWINVLVNSGRLDALGVVEEFVNNPSSWREVCIDEAEVKKVSDFLDRRLGYLHIEYEDFDKARELFERLLEVPESRGFAQSELEYIDALQNKNPSSKTEEDNRKYQRFCRQDEINFQKEIEGDSLS